MRSDARGAKQLDIDPLRSRFRGTLILPDDGQYDTGRAVWNGMIDRYPALIARCAGMADVINAVEFARTHDLLVAVRGGGHNIAGFGTCDNGIVIDLSPMMGVRVDLRAQTVHAQAGLTWGELDHETQAFGLATTGGLVSTTGIAGFTLGGGIGWLMRKHGLTIDNLASADVVTADGRVVTASPTENTDLFWGLRGGGGNFGIVTSFEYRLHPVGPLVLGGAVFHRAEHARALLRFYDRWAPTLPDELTTMVAFITAPPAPLIPQTLHGTAMIVIALCYAGPIAAGEWAVKPLKEFAPPALDLVGPIPYKALQAMFDETAPRGIHGYWKTHYVPELTDGAVDTLVEQFARMRSLSPFTTLHIHHLEGAVSRVDPHATAFGYREPRFAMNIVGLWNQAHARDPHVSWVRQTHDAMRPFTTGSPYLNFLGDEGADRVRAAYGRAKYDRLVQLKNKYDPTNFFRVNQNIKPVAETRA